MKVGRNVVLCGKSLWYQTLPFVMEYELGGDRAVIIVSALVAIAIEFLYFSVKRQHWYRGVPLQRQLVFPCTRSCYNC